MYKKKVAVGMSGGVDSAVSAYLLKEQGYDVTGVFLQCWDFKADGCRSEEDKAAALMNASHLGIKFVHINYVKQYKETVIKYFYDAYRAGRTPNPDVMCNKEIKFGLFFDWAMQEGFDYIATGHYARIEEVNGAFKLLAGKDASKDQSYFLYSLGQKHLAKTLFPIGNMHKKDVRTLAAMLTLPSADRPDSMGICFIGEVDVAKFIEKEIPKKIGKVFNMQGEEIGEHDGIWFYTIGQRHGFKTNVYHEEPLYVVKKDIEHNILYVGSETLAYSKSFYLTNVSWVGGVYEASWESLSNLKIRARHLGQLSPCTICRDANLNLVQVNLEKPIFAIAEGQSAVLYLENEVLGGGVICSKN